MEIFASISERLAPADVGAFAKRVEAVGYDGLSVPDAVHDALLLACLALRETTRLTVSTSVLVAFPRSPMNVAIAAWDLQHLSGGRFELGLGTQIRQNIEGRYSATWLPPISGMRDYLDALRAIFHSFQTGAGLHHVGPHYRFTRLQPFFNPGPIEPPHPALMIGAVGPKMLRLAGETADGLHVHPTSASPAYLREVVQPAVADGAAQAGRNPGLVPICVAPLVATGADDKAAAKRREHFRRTLAFLFSTPAYRASLAFLGREQLGERLQALTREQRWDEMTACVDDAILDAFVPAAPYARLPAMLHERFDGITRRIHIPVPDDPADDTALASAIAALHRLAARTASRRR